MSYYIITLAANKPVNMTVAGTVILIDDLGAAPGLDITPSYGGHDLPKMPNRKKAFKFMESFDAVTLSAPVDCTVALFLSKNDVSLGFADGSLVNVSGQVSISNTSAARVPVDVAGGVVNVTATNVGINNDNTSAVPTKLKTLGTIVNNPAQVVDTVAALLVSETTFERLHIRNASDTQNIALGGSGVTFANAAVILAPGDSMIEDQAAGAAWYAVADQAGAAARVMGVHS